MIRVCHRINTIAQLDAVPSDYGVELDLRDNGKDLIIHHDAFSDGEKFEDYLTHYRHRLMIVNTKSEGLEARILELLEAYQVQEYFFLDLSLPFLIKYANKGLRKIAVRFSEYEPIEFVRNFKDKIEWVWVDCFTKMPLTPEIYQELKRHFKLCLVSPELQGHDLLMIDQFKLSLQGMQIDAVCTKRPECW